MSCLFTIASHSIAPWGVPEPGRPLQNQGGLLLPRIAQAYHCHLEAPSPPTDSYPYGTGLNFRQHHTISKLVYPPLPGDICPQLGIYESCPANASRDSQPHLGLPLDAPYYRSFSCTRTLVGIVHPTRPYINKHICQFWPCRLCLLPQCRVVEVQLVRPPWRTTSLEKKVCDAPPQPMPAYTDSSVEVPEAERDQSVT